MILRRARPLWRTGIDVLMFLVVLALALKVFNFFGSFDLDPGNARSMDGDSLQLNKTEVRLHGIDAPEFGQTCGSPSGDYPCGRDAQKALATLIRERMISCTVMDVDRYGRSVAICHDGPLELNREMVRLGWAVAYIRHSTAYLAAQREAKAAKRGMWRGKFEMPEDYRRKHQPVASSVAAD